MGKPNAHQLPEHLRLGPGGYYLDYTVFENGRKKRMREKLGPIPLKLAKNIRDQRMAELAKGKFLGIKPKVTFRQAGEAFLDYARNRKRSWKKDVQSMRMLNQALGELPLEEIRPQVVEGFLRQLRVKGPSGKPLKDSTLNLHMALLKTVLNRAVVNGLVEHYPLRGLKLFKLDNQRDRVLSPTEFEALRAACPAHLKPIVTMAFFTAMRRGEILNLRWDQVDLKAGVIRLAAGDTKTAERREVPLDAGLRALIQAQPRVAGLDRVFTWRGRAIADIKTAFNKACADAGITDFRFHDLRHCAITNLRKAGVDQTTIMSISGHKTAHVFRRYNHIDRGDRMDALSRVRHFYDTARRFAPSAEKHDENGKQAA